MARILICYYSHTGHTKEMAINIAKGASIDGCTVALKGVEAVAVADMLAADAIIIGSPTYYGCMAYPVKKLIDESVVHHGKLEGKIGGAFSTAGMLGGGSETTVRTIIDACLIHGMVVVGNARMAHYGPVAIGAPNAKAKRECQAYGKRIAQLALSLAR